MSTNINTREHFSREFLLIWMMYTISNRLTSSCIDLAVIRRVLEVDKMTWSSERASVLVFIFSCHWGGVLQEGVGVFDLQGSSVFTSYNLGHSIKGLQAPPTSFSGAGTRHSVALAGLKQGLCHGLGDAKTG